VTEPANGTDKSFIRLQLRAFVELFALCGFAITYPLLELYGRSPEQFVFRGADRAQIVAFALIVTLLVPLVLWIGETLLALAIPRLRIPVHTALIGLLVAVFAIQILRGPLAAPLAIVLGSLVGAGAGWLYLRAEAIRLWLAFAGLAPLLFVGTFLFASETSQLLTSDHADAAQIQVGQPAPVVMIVFDELPLTSLIDGNGEIDRDLYPHFGALADTSHWFRNTTTVSPSTWHAVPSIVTGRYPTGDGAPISAEHPENLFTLLGDGYDMRVTESITRLCPSNLCEPSPSAAPGGLRVLLDDAADIMQSRLSPSDQTQDRAAALYEEAGAAAERKAKKPADLDDSWGDFDLNQPARIESLLTGFDDNTKALHYLHILLPHVPYRYLPSGMQYPAPDLDRHEDIWVEEEWPVLLARQRHLLQVAYVDTLIGQVKAGLEAAGVYDEALVVVTSDHGISFRPGGSSRALEDGDVDADVLADMMWVPLFVKLPGQQTGEISDANIMTIDILPTIADVLDIELPWEIDGRSAFGPPRPDDVKVFYNSVAHSFGVMPGDALEIDGADLWPRVLETSVDRFVGPSGDALRIWRVGPFPSLVGLAIDDVSGADLVLFDVVLEQPGDFEDVNPASGSVPAVIKGHVPDLEIGATIAVTVNGIIVATAPSFNGADDARFGVVSSDRWFRPGSNDVAVYRVDM
jgi:hypothetical protein